MKILLMLVCLTSMFCDGKRESANQINSVSYDSIPVKKLQIKDERQYSQIFIKSLRDFISSDSKVDLSDSVISFSDRPKSKIKFPRYPRIEKNYTFTGNKNLVFYELNVHRTNYSDVEFHLILKKGLENIYDLKGVATINPGFINGAEMFEDELTNGGYAMYGYESNDNCAVTLYISTPYVGEQELKARLKEINCANDRIQQIIRTMPTLRTKIM